MVMRAFPPQPDFFGCHTATNPLRSCTPTHNLVEDGSPDFVCHQRMDFSPPPAPSHRSSADGVTVSPGTTPRQSMSSASSGGFSVQFHGVHPFASHNMFHVPLSSTRTPKRPDEETQYREKVAEMIKRSNSDNHSNEPFTQLCDYMFVGGIPSRATAEALYARGVTDIINVVHQQYPSAPFLSEMFNVVNLKAEDRPDYYIIDYNYVGSDGLRAHMDSIRQRGGKAFVHCFAGINRSVSLCVAYLLEQHDWELADVVQHIHNRGRRFILDNVGFQHQLIEFYFNDVLRARTAVALPPPDLISALPVAHESSR